MPREPAHDAKRSQDGEAPAASERAEAWRAEASARRRGTGSREPHDGPAARPLAGPEEPGKLPPVGLKPISVLRAYFLWA